MQTCSQAFMGQFKEALDNNYEEPIAIYKEFFLLFGMPNFLKKIVLGLVGMFKSKRMAKTGATLKKYSSDEIDNLGRRNARFERYFKQRWDNLKLDAVICPTFPHCSYKHAQQKELAFMADYFMLWNVVHYPAGVVPVTEVLPGEDQGYTDRHNDVLTHSLRASMQGSVGMPIGIQVAAPKWKDEECLAVMQILDESLKFRKHPRIKKTDLGITTEMEMLE